MTTVVLQRFFFSLQFYLHRHPCFERFVHGLHHGHRANAFSKVGVGRFARIQTVGKVFVVVLVFARVVRFAFEAEKMFQFMIERNHFFFAGTGGDGVAQIHVVALAAPFGTA